MDDDSLTSPPQVASEHVMLSAFLDYFRDTIVRKVSGLTNEELRRR